MAVTAQDMLKKAMDLMGEESKYQSGYAPFLIEIINYLLADCFAVNNAYREDVGKEPLTQIPSVSKPEDEIPYEYAAIELIMIHGLAYQLLFQDDEADKANMEYTIYEQNKARFSPAVYTDVINNY